MIRRAPGLTMLAPPRECEHCHEAAACGLVCERCGEIQPRPGMDKFSALGLRRTHALDTEQLEARYRDLSRRLHPDRFASAPPRARVLSLQASTLLNDAYRTLRAPVSRAEYLLQLEGLAVDGARVAPHFLVEMMELREELEEARERGDDARLRDLRQTMEARREGALAAVEAGLDAWERTGERARLEEVRDHLVALRYHQRYLEALDGAGED